MEWLLVLLGAGAAAGLGRRFVVRRAAGQERQEELEGVRRLANEDVTLLGEELQRLDAEVSGQALDETTRLDYQRALDAYESAQRIVPRIRRAEEISKVTDTLSTGRYALVCVQARCAGRPIPELRVPCFFNPQHGPSSRDVLWTQPGRGTRLVPACAQDAGRIAQGDSPAVRKVKIGSRAVPYWEAGSAYLPYVQGYFVGAVALGPPMGWATEPTPVDFGGGSGFDGGGFGGSGFDGGGGFDAGGGGGGGDA